MKEMKFMQIKMILMKNWIAKIMKNKNKMNKKIKF